MKLLRIHELEAGMVLTESACAAQGQLLLPAATRLNDKHIKVLKAWGVTKVKVEGKEPGLDRLHSGEAAEQFRAIQHDLDERFGDTVRNPVMEEIRRVAEIQIQKRIIKGIA